ncbi:ADP-ribose glycohydrolase OARD1 [Frankliniella fusca]|uniref:ADP-ribose glycohydrolase OARD1 n=1 Tax=Frankliniella fusca TaxID=407009 RepID=A0AAE1LS07_9NEOP|nr:ADP-ribose glycohydrolase OARD1 [Frankliniella fusca]
MAARIVELWGDVFAMPTALAHAVSADLHMGAGIAVGFKEYFGKVDELKQQDKKVGDVAYIKHNSTYIFYLITKERYSDKNISPDDVLSCLVHLSSLCVSLGVEEISMPRLGCGLDLLKYSDVLPLIHAAFFDVSVRVNIITPPPTFNGMAVLGDSQGVRLLLNRGKLPSGFQTKPFPRSAGFAVSGITTDELLQTLDKIPNNSLGDALVFIGTNDVMALAAMESGQHVAKRKIRQTLSILRTVLSKKCKAYARAVITTVPPLPKLLAPNAENADLNRHLWSTFNKALLELSTPRFFVLDVEPYFMKDGLVQEELFESFMGQDAKRRPDRMHLNPKGMDVIEEALKTVPPFQPPTNN